MADISNFVHRDIKNGNFVEPIGETRIVTTTTTTGPWAAMRNATIVLKKVGNRVSAEIPGLTGVSATGPNPGGITLPNLFPVGWRPNGDVTTLYFSVPVINSNVISHGIATVNSVGTVYIVNAATSPLFTIDGGNAGNLGTQISFELAK